MILKPSMIRLQIVVVMMMSCHVMMNGMMTC